MTVYAPAAAGVAGGAAPWAPSTAYAANQLVQYNGVLYAALAAFTSGASFNATNWRALTAATLTSSLAFGQRAGTLLTDRTADMSRGESNGTDTDGNSRLKFYVNRATNSVVLVASGWKSFTAVASNPVTYKFSIELASGGVLPVYFNEASDGRAVTVQPGALLFSVPVALPSGLAAGDYIYIRTRVVVTAGQKWPLSYCTDNVATGSGGPGEGIERGTGTTDKVDTGTITVAYDNAAGPIAVLGDQFSTGRGPVGAAGDSITRGAGTSQELWSGPTTDFWGPVRKACYLSNPVTNVGVSGDTAQAFAAATGLRRLFVSAARYVVFGLAVNDLIAGRTAAQIKADIITCGRQVAANGALSWCSTITPRTTSTDAFVTVANQTAFANEADRVLVNTWIRAGMPIDPTTKAPVAIGTSGALLVGVSGHPFAGYIEMANVVESAQDSGKWKAISGVTGDRTNGSNQITNVSGGAWVVGSPIDGTGIPGQSVVTVIAGSTLTISKNATSTGTGTALTSVWTSDGLHPVNVATTALAGAVPVASFI